MTDNPRLQQLLDELLDSQATPEEVCASCPELLPEVRARWRKMCRLQADLDALFPASPEQGTSPPALPPAGTALPQVPGYEVEGVLGRGGMGVVYRAWHLRLHRPVALKMLLAGAYAQPAERERFQREAEAVAALRHPNIVQVYDVGDVDGRPYFTMEFVEGGSLAEQIQGVPQPARQAAALVATLAEAVHAAHQSGIVHRDLKPANVLLTADGTPKVTDFGLARRLDGDGGLTLSGMPDRHAELHGPRAGAGRQERHRAGDGRLRPGGDPVRAAHGPAAVPRRDGDGDAAAGGGRRAGAARAAEPAGAARPGNHLPEVPAQGAAPPLRQRRRRWPTTCAASSAASRSRPAPWGRWSAPCAGCDAGRPWPRRWPPACCWHRPSLSPLLWWHGQRTAAEAAAVAYAEADLSESERLRDRGEFKASAAVLRAGQGPAGRICSAGAARPPSTAFANLELVTRLDAIRLERALVKPRHRPCSASWSCR